MMYRVSSVDRLISINLYLDEQKHGEIEFFIMIGDYEMYNVKYYLRKYSSYYLGGHFGLFLMLLSCIN